MTSIKVNPFLKEINTTDKNYQLNMDILSSLKNLPNKIVNLQPEKIIFNNENLNKKVIFPEEKFSTSSSISKELFSEPFSNDVEKISKKSYTTNSVFKPFAYNPIKKTTMNFYNFGSMMSFSEFITPNPNQINPFKITNSSFSKNSFYPLMNPEMSLVNPNNLTNPNYSINPINFINPINNNINPVNPLFQNFTQISLINDQIIKKNNLNQTKNNIFLNKKRNADNLKINFNIKEKENKEKENKEKEIKIFNDIKKTNESKNIIQKPKNALFYVKQQSHQENKENPSKKNLFTVIQKSNYIYKKRKPRKKKLFNGIKNKINCGHEGCEGIFKTKKQLVFHHYKMNSDCHNDTINLIKMINLTKKILLKKVEQKEKLLEKYSELYKETMKKISLDEHIETLVGLNFEDELNEKI